jgi:biotin-(acetyl-CoA carboxylase) ligase
LANFQENGKADLIRNYYKFWLHSDEEVTILRSENGQYEKAIIKGLDDDGYLLVRNKETGQNISLQSDGKKLFNLGII